MKPVSGTAPRPGSLVSVCAAIGHTGSALLYADTAGGRGGALVGLLRKGSWCLVLGEGYDNLRVIHPSNRMLRVVAVVEEAARVGWIYYDNVREIGASS